MTELIEQHFGVLELYEWSATLICFWHETGPEKSCPADIWHTRLQTALRVFFVSVGPLGLRRFGGRANSLVFAHNKQIVPGKFGYQIGAPDA